MPEKLCAEAGNEPAEHLVVLEPLEPFTDLVAGNLLASGGKKNSGFGRFNGKWAIDEFTTDHTVSVQQAPREYPF